MTLQLSGLRAPEVSQQEEKKSNFKNAYTSDALFLLLTIEMLIFRCGYKCMRGTLHQTHILETKHSRCICRAMQIIPQCEDERIKEAQERVYTYNDGGKYVHLLSSLSHGY